MKKIPLPLKRAAFWPSKHYKNKWSWPISRVLSRTVIHLGCTSLCTSSDLPRSRVGHTLQLTLLLLYLVLLQVGFTIAVIRYRTRGALLPHRFTLAGLPVDLGGFLSAALSVGSRPPGVTWHFAL